MISRVLPCPPTSAIFGRLPKATTTMPSPVSARCSGQRWPASIRATQSGHNWVEMLKIYYSRKNGTNLYLNNPAANPVRVLVRTPAQPAVLSDLRSLSRHAGDEGAISSRLRIGGIKAASRWERPTKSAPNFDHTSFNFTTGQPFDNPKWKEPDAAAGVAYLEYLAFAETKDKKYLQGGKLGVAVFG